LPNPSADVIICFNGGRIRDNFKVIPYKNPNLFSDNPAKNRYEAEERILTEKLPIKYISKVIIFTGLDPDNHTDEVIELLKEKGIPYKVLNSSDRKKIIKEEMVSSCVGDNTIPMRMPIKPISIMNYIEK
jgi:hypothetical protein